MRPLMRRAPTLGGPEGLTTIEAGGELVVHRDQAISRRRAAHGLSDAARQAAAVQDHVERRSPLTEARLYTLDPLGQRAPDVAGAGSRRAAERAQELGVLNHGLVGVLNAGLQDRREALLAEGALQLAGAPALGDQLLQSTHHERRDGDVCAGVLL